MKVLRPVTEDEVIAVFLRAEVDSGRYGEKTRGLLARDARTVEILRDPDITSQPDNDYRRALLDEHRYYERRDGLFGGFPREIEWFRATLPRNEVLDILFINWDWWLTLSGGTRRPRDAARRIRAGEVPGVGVDGHEKIVAALTKGEQPELIAATTRSHERLVLIEGHYRLTAYALFPDRLPDELEILVGITNGITKWWAY